MREPRRSVVRKGLGNTRKKERMKKDGKGRKKDDGGEPAQRLENSKKPRMEKESPRKGGQNREKERRGSNQKC